MPSNPTLFTFEQFTGLNTKPLRPGIQDQEMSWCDGLMPIGPNNLRTLYGVGEELYTAAGSLIIIFYAFGNIHAVPYCYVFLSDGSVVQVNTNTGAITQIATAGTIQNPSQTNIGFCQWGSKYILFSADQTDGYWIWDGSNLFEAGTVGPQVIMLRSGEDYTSQPTVELTTTGAGSGATFEAELKNGSIENMNVTSPGSGFAIDDLINLNISGGGSDNTAKATVSISSSGGVEAVYVTNGGHDYSGTAQAVATGGGGSGASFSVSGQGGAIIAINIINPGTGYTSAPTITITGGGSGAGFSGFATIFIGQVTSVAVTDGGTGYKTPPTISVIGDGNGAELRAQIDSSGSVTAIQIVNGGRGYTKGLVHFSGGNKAAEAVVALMPFGVSGTTIEVYTNRAWIGNGSRGIFTAPSDPVDVTVSNGAGAFQSNDSFLRVSYRSFKQSNGFLYLIADSSMNYISGVRTDGSPPLTTYSNQNVDPQIGSPWPNTVQVFSRNIMFANSFGVHISYGGAVTKVSQPLDGVYNTVPDFGSFIPSSAVASIFGIQVYMILLPVIDPSSGQQANKLFMWDGKKWWSSGQDVNLTFVATQEVDSVLTSWGTDGLAIYPLFQNKSAEFSKIVQSKLWANPSYLYMKTATRLYGLINHNHVGGGVTTVTVDNENGSTSTEVSVQPPSLVWTNDTGQAITWENASSQVISWIRVGLVIFGPVSIAQNGRLIGITLKTEASDIALLSVIVLGQAFELMV